MINCSSGKEGHVQQVSPDRYRYPVTVSKTINNNSVSGVRILEIDT